MADELEVRNPFTGEIAGRVAVCGLDDVETIVARARGAKPAMDALTSYERGRILQRASERLAGDVESWARLITAEMGKPISDARFEVRRAVETFRLSAEEATRLWGEVIPGDVTSMPVDKIGLTRRVPVGVVLAVTPFNFPLNIAAHKVGPALAAGNRVILKPSRSAPLTALRMGELLDDCGLPPGAMQVVCLGREAAEKLVAHPGVNMVTLTGGTDTGRRVAALAGAKKISLELGGNDPLIVMADADLDAAAATAVDQRFGTSGQRCTAVKRVLVQRPVAAEFMDKLLALTERVQVGDPADDGVRIGPLITEAAAVLVERRINDACDRGATLRAGGRREKSLVWPTVLQSPPPDCELVAEETFGPVLPVFVFDEVDEAIDLANSTPYGLQAGLFTRDLDTVKRFFDGLEVGAVIVNGGPGFRQEHLPFGGVKASGVGREGIRFAMLEMTETKLLVW